MTGIFIRRERFEGTGDKGGEFHVKTEAEIRDVLPLTKEFQGLSATTGS